jgi:exodeoxyribonuclease VII large subunit
MTDPQYPISNIQHPIASPQTWTVSGLTQHITQLLESDDLLQDVWLHGEMSNPRQYPSGHLYFTLKDAEAALSCVMWRSAARRLSWEPQQGDAVLAHGHISVYAVRGNYQLYVDRLRPAGRGDLHARFEQLRDQLKAEGLFDDERKQRVPEIPRVLGIVTSPQAAAFRDVLNVLGRRYPLVQVLLAPTLVQGDQAPPRIVSALRALDAHDDVDTILLVRGGGSLEDLWAFNDERVARAIAACRHPVISGVGHETDFTIADFVADQRAPTPSAAAELAVPDQADLWQMVLAGASHLERVMVRRLDQARQALDGRQRELQRLSPQAHIDARRQQADELTHRASRALTSDLALRRSRLAGLQARLESLSPLATLRRGYAVVRLQDTGMVVRSVDQVTSGDELAIRVQDGEFEAVTRSET